MAKLGLSQGVQRALRPGVVSVTMPAFGGEGLKTLFVTSAADEGREGGGLYACQPGVAGLPIPVFDPEA